MSTFAIVVDPKARIYEPEQLRNKPIAVSPYNGSHFTMLKMLEGFLNRDQIKWVNAGHGSKHSSSISNGTTERADSILAVCNWDNSRAARETHRRLDTDNCIYRGGAED